MNLLNSAMRAGNLEVKNRIVMPPMATSKATGEGYVTQQLCDYYHEKSLGDILDWLLPNTPM